MHNWWLEVVPSSPRWTQEVEKRLHVVAVGLSTSRFDSDDESHFASGQLHSLSSGGWAGNLEIYLKAWTQCCTRLDEHISGTLVKLLCKAQFAKRSNWFAFSGT
jgi:hypothetical protein